MHKIAIGEADIQGGLAYHGTLRVRGQHPSVRLLARQVRRINKVLKNAVSERG